MADTPIAQSTIDAANAQPPVPASQPTDPGAAPDVLGGPSAASTAGGSLVQNPSAPSPPPSASQVLSGRQPSGFKAGLLSGLAGRQYTNDAQGNVVPKSVASGASGGLGTILGTLAMGALASLGGVQRGQRGAAAAGAGYRAANDQLQNQDQINREKAQQNFANQQKVKQEQMEQVRTMDEHTRTLAETATANLNNHLIGMKINQLEKNIPLEDAESKMALTTQRFQLSQLATKEFGPEIADLKTFADAKANPKIAAGLANGSMINIPQYNDKGAYTGEKIYNKSMDSRPIDHAITLPDTLQITNGKITKIPGQIYEAGTISNGDLRTKIDSVVKENAGMQENLGKIQLQKDQASESRAKAAQGWAAAGLANAEAKNMASFGVAAPPANFRLPDNAMSMNEQDLETSLRQQGVQLPPDFKELYAIGHYNGDLHNYTKTLRKGVPQRDMASTAALIRTYINPNLDEREYPAMASFLKGYENGSTGLGAQRLRLSNTIGHLDQLGQAAQGVAQNNVQLLNQIANTWHVAIGKSPVITYEAIANKLSGELAGGVKGGSGSATDQEIEKMAKSADTKLSPEQQYKSIVAQYDVVNTVVNDIDAQFKDTMKASPEQLGHHTLNPEAEKIVERWRNSTDMASASPTAQPPLQHLYTNGNQTIGWNGNAWVDSKTRQPIQVNSQ